MRYPLELSLKPSRQALMGIAAVHAVAAIAFLYSSLSSLVIVATILVLTASTCAAFRAERRKAGCVLLLEDAGTLRIDMHGRPVSALPGPGCTDFGWALWLQWQPTKAGLPTDAVRSIMILRDNVPPGSWRALRIWLRHKMVSVHEGKPSAGETKS